MARSDVAFTRLRRRMTDDLGIDPRQAERLLDDMLGRVLTRFGDDFVRGKSELLDQMVDLRDRLDGLYHEVLNFDSRTSATTRIDTRSRSSIDQQLRDIDQLYRQLDQTLSDLGKPLHEIFPDANSNRNLIDETVSEIRGAATSQRRPGHEHRDIEVDIRPEGRTRRSRIRRKGFQPDPPDQSRRFTRDFADGSQATFSIENGMYHVETRDAAGNVTGRFTEFDILSSPYARRPLTTSLMQAHHGLQNSIMTKLFEKFGYDGGAAPTIWLRNSRRGSPHGSITAVQNSAKSSRGAATTLSQLRQWAIEDLRLAQMPEAQITTYLRVFDEYFASAVLPKLRAEGRLDLLGEWTPPGGP
jgi:hypothetical protein